MDVKTHYGEYVAPGIDVITFSSPGVLCGSVFDERDTTETTPGGFLDS